MNQESGMERDLRAALRRAEPPRDLLPAIAARLESPRRAPRPWWRLAAAGAMAAALILALSVGAVWQWRQRQAREQRARVAAAELAQALHLAAVDLQRVQMHFHATAGANE